MSKKANTTFCCENVYDPMFEGYAMFAVVRDENREPRDYRFLEVNRQFKNIAGVQRAEIIGKTLGQVLAHAAKSWADIFNHLWAEESTGSFECCFQMDGKHFRVSAFRPSEEIVVTMLLEITIQKQAETALEIHKILFEGAQDIILYVNLDGQLVASNQRACEAYGYTKAELLTKNIQDLRHASTLADYGDQMRQAETCGVVFESLHLRSDGSAFPVEVSSRMVHTENGPLRIHIIRDITQRKAQEEKIAWLARYDALTGIQNRASLMIQLEQEIQRARRSGARFAVMLFDIDKFKLINDHYGHEAGDVVLRHVAEKVRAALRTTDQIGRLGGDEFVVLQTDVKEPEGVSRLAQRIHAAAAEPVLYNGAPLQVKISIGISLFPADAEDTDTLLLCADQAMYTTKKSGGGSYSFFIRDIPLAEK